MKTSRLTQKTPKVLFPRTGGMVYCYTYHTTKKDKCDVEEELGIDLITLTKALKGIYIKDKERIYFVGSPYLCFAENSERQLEFQLRVGDTWHYIKDYGKTWALTKKELENE